jgi:hypothetical protein
MCRYKNFFFPKKYLLVLGLEAVKSSKCIFVILNDSEDLWAYVKMGIYIEISGTSCIFIVLP